MIDTQELRRSVDQLVSVSVSVNQLVSHVYLLYLCLHIHVFLDVHSHIYIRIYI